MDVGDLVRLQGLKRSPELNGRLCVVTGFNCERVLVRLEHQKVW